MTKREKSEKNADGHLEGAGGSWVPGFREGGEALPGQLSKILKKKTSFVRNTGLPLIKSLNMNTQVEHGTLNTQVKHESGQEKKIFTYIFDLI